VSTIRNPGISVTLAVLWLCVLGSQSAAQTGAITGVGTTLTSLFSFASTNGERPVGALVQATDENFYGTTEKVNWSEFGFIPVGGRFNPDEQTLSPHNVHGLHKLWSFFTGCSGEFCGGSSATVASGVVYVGSYDGNLYALNAATGAKLWSYHTGNQVFASPTVVNGVVYVGSGDGNMYAFGL
jgi:outer membrane protein assembly factor BamB